MMNKLGRTSEAYDAESIYAKAAKSELSKDYDMAFKLYIKAAESFLHLSRSANEKDKDKVKWNTSARKAVERAEKIKTFVEKTKSSGLPPTADSRLTPIVINHFSTREQFHVLKKGGSINGLAVPLWDEPPLAPAASLIYQDPDGQPKLSPEQLAVSPIWRHPPELDVGSNIPLRQVLPEEILQHIVTDCSLCASISVCLEHGRRFGSKLAQSTLHVPPRQTPSSFNASRGPSRSEGSRGRYDVKFLFNGAWRRIDDTLPFHPLDGTLVCMSVIPSTGDSRRESSQSTVLWPSLLEKAYMKLMGGYDFPGSNSSIDLHTLAGWIPEQIDIKGSVFEREKTWERISKGFTSGRCVLTLGTGASTNLRWRNTPLLESHSYAIIDVSEHENERSVTVLDSWMLLRDEVHQQSRMLHIPWSDVLNVFDGIYVNWDPQRWSKMLTFHGMWKRNGEDELSSTRQHRIRFTNVNNSMEEEIWILLTRHVVDTRRTSDFIALKVQTEDDFAASSNTIDQFKIAVKGTYTNSTHILVRARITQSQRSGVLSIFASYDGRHSEVGFTLTAFAQSSINITWDEDIPNPPYTTKITGALTSKTSGGNCTYPSFMSNPQYHLHIHPPSGTSSSSRRNAKVQLAMALQSSRDMPVNIAIVWSQGERAVELSEPELAASSGAYSYGLARVSKELPPGDYTVVLSAFEPHHTGPFSLRIDSSAPFDFKPIPQEGAGMYSKVLYGAWDSHTAGGGPTFECYCQNPIFEITVPSPLQLKIRLQLIHPSTGTSLNVTLYPASTDGSFGRHITTSGAYDDGISGVTTPQLALSAGKYWAVPSTYNPGVEVGFRLIVYTTISGVDMAELLNRNKS